MPITETSLRAVSSMDAALGLLGELGYAEDPVQVVPEDLGLDSYARHALIRQGHTRREGYAVFVAEIPQPPESLAAVARQRQNLNDAPLGVPGVVGARGRWERFLVVPPERWTQAVGS